MSGFTSSYQGLTGPSQAGLALTAILAAGMICTAPDLDLINHIQLEWATYARLPANMMEGFPDIAQIAALQLDLDFAAFQSHVQEWQVQSLYQLNSVFDAIKEPILHQQAVWSAKAKALNSQLLATQALIPQMIDIQDVVNTNLAGIQESVNSQLSAAQASLPQMSDIQETVNTNVAGIQASLNSQLSAAQASLPEMSDVQEAINTNVAGVQASLNSQLSAAQASLPQMSDIQD